MPEQPFVVKDRRKFTAEGELRPESERSQPDPAEELVPRAVAEAAAAAPEPPAKPAEPVGKR